MNPSRSLIACLAVFVLFAARGAGNAEPPTFRDDGEWIVFSGTKKEGEALKLWTYAIRKTAVVSVTVEASGDQSDEGSPEELGKLPAELRLTTSEITDEGASRNYRIGGLTHAAASAMLTGILEAIGAPEKSNPEEKKAELKRALRFLPVGAEPPWEEIEIQRDDGRGKARLQAEPAVGSVPPHQVALVNEEGTAEGEPVTLTLNHFSPVVAVLSDPVRLHESNPGGVKSKMWHASKFPPDARAALAILWRDPELKKWDKAVSLTLPDDLTAFPAGAVRIVNVSGFEVELELDGKTSMLPHGEAFLHPAQEGETHLKVRIGSQKKRIVVANQQINQDAKERAHVILYRADGDNPRRPVKALALREIARTPAVPLKHSP